MSTSAVRSDSATRSTSASAAAITFVVCEFVAFALWMFLGRHQWFLADEWAFLSDRRGGSLHDLFRDHNTHWSTTVVVAYRVLWNLFGLRSYLPYLATVVALHLACAAMLRVVMRRAGVSPWIATAAAALFAFFGAGFQDIVWASDIGFNSALFFGLVALVLADHDGQLGRRDALALGAGVTALASSGVGLVMVGVVVLSVFVRRGWRVASFSALALGGVYATWFLLIGHEGATNSRPSAMNVFRFVRVGIAAAFRAIGQLPGAGALFAALAIAGIVVGLATRGRSALWPRAALPAAMAVGAPAFLVVSGYGRVDFLGPDSARASRYVYVVVALLLPALAVGIDALVRQWPKAVPFFVVLLLVGVPGNIDDLGDYTRSQTRVIRDFRRTVLALPRAPLAAEVPRAVRPLPENASMSKVTLGWLRDGVASGRIPKGGPLTPYQRANVALRLSLLQRPARGSDVVRCRALRRPEPLHLRQGESIAFLDYGLKVSTTPPTVPGPVVLNYGQTAGSRLTAVVPNLDLVVAPNSFAPRFCGYRS